jgi:cytidine deaminase
LLKKLMASARSASEHAYCPYSHFRVGAAVLTEDDEIFTGCNVENASYGLTICAERNAVFQAKSRGKLQVRRLLCIPRLPHHPRRVVLVVR